MEFIAAGMCFVFATVAMVFVTKLATIENEKGSRKKKSKDSEIDMDAYMQGYMAAMQHKDEQR